MAYCLAADIRMPDLGIEFHYWRTKRIITGDANVDDVCSALVGRTRRAFEGSLEMCEVIRANSIRFDFGEGIALDISKFFCNPPSSRHARQRRRSKLLGL